MNAKDEDDADGSNRGSDRIDDFAWGPDALVHRQEQIRRQHSSNAPRRDHYRKKNRYFHNLRAELIKFIVEPGARVLQIGCRESYLLDVVNPSEGLGLDIIPAFIENASARFPNLEFQDFDTGIENASPVYDYILVCNVDETIDLLALLDKLKPLANADTRFVFMFLNHVWRPIISLGTALGMAYPRPEQNWFSVNDVRNLLALAGFETVREHRCGLFPKYIPVLSWIANKLLKNMPLFRRLCVENVLVARILDRPEKTDALSVSVVVPCKDEEGNVAFVAERIPEMGTGTEIIFCDDKSTDGTVAEVKRMQAEYPDRDIKLVHGPGVCKADNVWTGFDAATGDILMILDADLTVMPEELPRFYEIITQGKGELINGSRMIYPMQADAMRTLNIFGNKMFSLAFTLILGQSIKDTLCGTKVLWRRDWPRLKKYVGTWGQKDRWGDFDLIFGAVRLNLKVIDLPVHYLQRIEGETKMTHRLRNAWRMARMCLNAYRKFNLE